MSELQPLLEQMIERWRADDIPIRPGVDATTMANFESRYSVELPDDMREYFATVDGTGDHYDNEWFYRFWPLGDVRSAEEYVPGLTEALPESVGYFFFFDHSIDLFMYAIRLNASKTLPTPIARIRPQRDGSFNQYCESFTEFISKYVGDPANIL